MSAKSVRNRRRKERDRQARRADEREREAVLRALNPPPSYGVITGRWRIVDPGVPKRDASGNWTTTMTVEPAKVR